MPRFLGANISDPCEGGMIERSGTPTRVKAPGLYLGATHAAWLAEVAPVPLVGIWRGSGATAAPAAKYANLTIHPDPMRGFPATIPAGASKTAYPKALQVGKGDGAEISTGLG